jgi:UTP--glucose-1-phosphate uridylyltransferase
VKVRKAVITAASERQRELPLQNLIIRNGQTKPVLAILIEQVLLANVEEICVVVRPGDEARYERALQLPSGRIRFVPQSEPRGYGHAVWCARDFLNGEPFLHLVGDHLYVNADGTPPAAQLLDVARTEECSVSAVQITREGLLPYFGAVGGRRLPGPQALYRVDTVLEKPTPTEAERKLCVAGLRSGYYLCFFGMHVLTPAVIDLLAKQAADSDGPMSLSTALADLAREEQYLALEAGHRRYDIGARYGLLTAQLALALHGPDRAEILAQLVELLATQEAGAGAGAGGR